MWASLKDAGSVAAAFLGQSFPLQPVGRLLPVGFDDELCFATNVGRLSLGIENRLSNRYSERSHPKVSPFFSRNSTNPMMRHTNFTLFSGTSYVRSAS